MAVPPASSGMHGCRIVTACWLLAGFSWAAAGNGSFLVNVWQTSEGLPHNAPTTVLQTQDSYLWIGTPSGLARFDGARFETFRVGDGLPDNRILSLMEDRHGALWIGTAKGIAKRSRGLIETMPDHWPDTAVWHLAEADDGALWLGTETGAWRAHRQMSPASITPDAGHPGVRALLPDGPDGEMWIMFRNSLWRWQHGQVTEKKEFAIMIEDREMHSLKRAPDGGLWVSGVGIVARGTPDGKAWQKMAAGMPDAGDIHLVAQPAADGTLWVATRNRGLRWLRNGAWQPFGFDEGLSHDDARGIFEDREGNFWVPTNGGGLNRLREQRLAVFDRSHGLGRQSTTAIAIDNLGTVWAATDGDGVMRLDGGNFIPGLPEGAMPDGFVWSMLAASDGALWVGTFRHGVLRWKNGQADWFRREQGLISNWIPCLMEDREGRIWIGTENGGLQVLSNGEVFTYLGAKGERGDPVIALSQDPEGDIWVGTAGYGLLRLHSNQFARFNSNDGLPDDLINALHHDDDGRLWIGTGRGLALRHQDGFHCWTVDDGLISNTILQIQNDHNGHLWLGTDIGLQRIIIAGDTAGSGRPRIFSAQTFSRPDGLPTPQFTGGHGTTAIRETGGALWFSLAAGAVRVEPFQSLADAAPAGLHITSLTAGGNEFWHFERSENQQVDLPPNAGGIQIRFTSPALRMPEKLLFQHRIHGLQEDWQEASQDRSITVGTLAPGNYRFEVMVAGQDSAHSAKTASLSFRVRPHWWQTMAFRIPFTLAIVALTVVVARKWSLRRLRRKMILLQQERHIDQERTRIARDLHDDLGSSLTEINFLGTLGLAGAQSQATRERLEGIVDRTQHMAKSLDEIVWTVNPVNDTLSSTANYLCSRAQESLNTAGIRCRLDIDEDLPNVQLDSERRHHLLMAVNEAINNVMKHSASNEAKLTLNAAGGTLIIVVADHGVGFNPAVVPPGRNGLRNMRRRMEAAGGSCEIESAPHRGSRVRISLPLHQVAHANLPFGFPR